jgi:hypothetical protein
MFRNILLILVGYLLIRFVYGIWKFRRVLKSKMKEMNADQQSNIPHGEMHVTDKTKKRDSSDSKDDSYVDYEEVE